jgi:hypothetical protein
MRDLNQIYDASFFESYNEEQESDIRIAADVLFDIFRPATALDVGCGPGMLVRRLRELNVEAEGWDGSENALRKAHDVVRPYLRVINVSHDAEFPLLIWPRPDLVVCTEVAEHVPESESEGLLATLCGNAGKWIVFTAAPPGQGGHDHINEQPMHYWISKFEARGWRVDETLTSAVRMGWGGLKRMWFYPANVRVFSR